MSKHTVFIEFFHPSNLNDILSYTTDDELKKACFVVTKYDTEEEAIDAYENSIAVWSVIIDDDQDVNKFINEAYEHLKSNDLNDRRWLYKHFI